MVKKHRESTNQATLSELDTRQAASISGGWCGTPVPGAFPPVPNPGPDPWMNRLGDIGKLGSLAGMQHVLVG